MGLESAVNFLMVCLELGQRGRRTAQEFGRRFQLPSAVINGYVEQGRELPSFGQLGCQGFIVLGPHGEFAVQRTVPCYLEASQKAFEAVESLLANLWNVRAVRSVPPAREINLKTPAVLDLPPVGVHELDEDHQAIEAAMIFLQQRKSCPAMRSLLALWRQHSQHEEQLFAEFDFGRHRTADPGRAATAPHCQHHEHIASMMESAEQAAAASCCGLVAREAIEALVAEIQRHADLYDMAYAGKLGVQGGM